MPLYPIVFKGAQIGLQSGLDDDGAADIKLGAPGFSRIMPKASGGYVHRSKGDRVGTATLPPGMRWAECRSEGPLDFRGIVYPASAGFGLDTPSASGTNGYEWNFSLPLNSEVEPQYLRYENGNAARAEKALNMFANAFTFNLSKPTQSYSVDWIMGKKERGVTITPSPDEIIASVVLAQSFGFYGASSKSALDTAVTNGTLFEIPLSVVITFPAIAEVQGRMNPNEDSWFARLPKDIAPTLALKCADDDDFDDLADLLDTGEPWFFAARALGRTIPGLVASQEEMRFDFCGTLIEPESPDEEGAGATNTLTFQNQYDSTWGQAHNIKVVNDMPGLQP